MMLLFDAPSEFILLIYSLMRFMYIVEEKHRRRRTKRKKIESILNDETDDDPPPVEKNYTDFFRMRLVDMTHWLAPNENGTSYPPDNFKRLPVLSSPNLEEQDKEADILVFSFTDGSLKFILCDYMSDEGIKSPKLIYEFVATPECTITKITACPWQSLHGAAYMTEFLTASSDNIVTHWGLRYDKRTQLCYVDSLGSIRMQ